MVIDYESRDAMKALRGPLSNRATSAEFNEWSAREVCEYIDTLQALVSEAREIISGFLADHPEETEREIRQGIANALDILDASRIDVTHPMVIRARSFLDRTGK